MRIKLFMVVLFSLIFGITEAFAQFQLQRAFTNLSFTQPVDLQSPADQTDRIFVVEKPGVIKVFSNDPQVVNAEIFLDISARVDDGGSEEGLLGLAFHPDFIHNGYFFVNYTASQPNRTVISRFRVSANNPNQAEPDSELVILEFSQPYSNHNGGQLAFGPQDGFLYIATGDGGSFGDPDCNAQDLSTLLGAILRINVNQSSGGQRYQIPTDNPFTNNSMGYREEIFAYGLRNPWRFSFDPVTNWIWAGDVGQSLWEEVDLIVSGGNYGWSMFEGFHCYSSTWPCTPPCDSTGLIMPIWEYNHNTGISITGGYVYRGTSVPELTGKYIYADYGSGIIWSLNYDGTAPPANSLLIDTNLQIVSFGTDQDQELYICAFDGNIYRFQATVNDISDPLHATVEDYSLSQNYPNPFNGTTLIPFSITKTGLVEIHIYDIRGRRVTTLLQEERAPGQYEVIWDAKNSENIEISSGLYYYQLVFDNESGQVKQLLYMK